MPSRGHDWTSHGRSLHRSVCTAFLHKPTRAERRSAEECPGVNKKLAAVLADPQGHRLFVASYGGLPLVFCCRCGAFGTDHFRNLAAPCRQPGPGGRSQLKRLLASKHPVHDVILKGVWDLERAKAMDDDDAWPDWVVSWFCDLERAAPRAWLLIEDTWLFACQLVRAAFAPWVRPRGSGAALTSKRWFWACLFCCGLSHAISTI